MSAKPLSAAWSRLPDMPLQTDRHFDQAALWRLLRLAGVDTLIAGSGRLMQEF
jgi:hypothetical protein